MAKKWYTKAVMEKPPYTLGWRKTQSTGVRRRAAIASRPKNWSLHKRRLSAARALTALANVTADRRTKELAKRDAEYFYKIIRVKKKKVVRVQRRKVINVRKKKVIRVRRKK